MKTTLIKLTLAGVLAAGPSVTSVYGQALEAHLTAITVFRAFP